MVLGVVEALWLFRLWRLGFESLAIVAFRGRVKPYGAALLGVESESVNGLDGVEGLQRSLNEEEMPCCRG